MGSHDSRFLSLFGLEVGIIPHLGGALAGLESRHALRLLVGHCAELLGADGVQVGVELGWGGAGGDLARGQDPTLDRRGTETEAAVSGGCRGEDCAVGGGAVGADGAGGQWRRGGGDSSGEDTRRHRGDEVDALDGVGLVPA